MGLRDVRLKAIKCLKAGRIQAVERSDITEKNLLKTGEISAEHTIRLLYATRGEQYKTQPHRDDPSVDVHYFEPILGGEHWHIKLYFLEPDCWFISVHKSHVIRRTQLIKRGRS